MTTVLLLLLSLGVAAGLSWFQYFYKAGPSGKIKWTLAALRFLSVFALLVLLINPILSRNSYEIVKVPLALVVDNSASIRDLKADASARAAFQKLASNRALQEQFDVQPFAFDLDLTPADTFAFNGKQSRLDKVGQQLSNLYRGRTYATVLLTDGNQTSGNDFVYAFDGARKAYPVILGDTVTSPDLRIAQVNVNKYAFLNNKFPVEAFVQYSGNRAVTANVAITRGNTVLHREKIDFSKDKRSALVNVLLPAEKSGVQVYSLSVTSNLPEKNRYNNSKKFAVEVMDQKTEIAIVSSVTHPDLGALKRAIASNAQRKVTLLKPTEVKQVSDYNVVILYQPSAAFKPLYDQLRNAGVNTFTITGTSTDFNFLNNVQDQLQYRMSGQSEEYLCDFNPQFSLYAQDDLGFATYPPLSHAFGNVTVKGDAQVMLGARIRNVRTGNPMLAFFEAQGKRSGVLLGENLWKWRLYAYQNTKSFEKFDVFIDKIIQYLATNNARKSLVVEHERFYNSGDAIQINAQFFNKNYEFDEKAQLTIALTHKGSGKKKQYDLLRGGNAYKVSLDGLEPGQYGFTVTEKRSGNRYTGNFEVLDFDIEKQFVNPDVAKLAQLAANTGAQLYLPDQLDALVQKLVSDPAYKPVQKALSTKTPVVDWVWLLVLIAVTLAAEWLLRKYHGML